MLYFTPQLGGYFFPSNNSLRLAKGLWVAAGFSTRWWGMPMRTRRPHNGRVHYHGNTGTITPSYCRRPGCYHGCGHDDALSVRKHWIV